MAALAVAAKIGAESNSRQGSNFFNFALQKIKGQRILSEHRTVSNPSAGINRTRFDGFTLSLFKLAAQVLIGRRAVLAMLTY
ncbi:hypothetical protein GCM10011328_22350 [Hafnia psychrotolerans]|uniref:Uncharacterized protein n=1 Tax=Hafnia psychrotolerans TaxID=1477018 RepID=A0ABQ1GMV1_9GAMM|nr:hypothetical protein GCM10011328_22350 [Hafnia psychrotolerans]